jgi:NTE family protein
MMRLGRLAATSAARPSRSASRPARPGRRRRSASSRRGRPATAFVLTGGASLGALQVGMLRALYEREVVPDMLVGTSVGALNAAFIASREQAVRTADDLARVWRGMQRHDIFPIDLRMLVGGLWGRRDHLLDAHGLHEIVRQHLEFDDLADSPIPVHVVAFDLAHGREARLSAGPAVDAILAATAIPGILPPVRIADQLLVDAAVVNNAPISHAVALGAERIYVLPTQGPSRAPGRLPRNALDAAIQALGMRSHDQLRADLVRYARDAELIVLPAPNGQRVLPTDFRHASWLAADGLAAARAALDELPATSGRRAGSAHLYAVSPVS